MRLQYRYPSLAVLFALITLAGLILGGNSLTQAEEPMDTEHAILLPVVIKLDFDLKVNSVKLIQGTTASENYWLAIANRETLMRVFVGTGSGKIVAGVTARMCGYSTQGNALGCIQPQNVAITAPSIESDLERTINFRLPPDWVKPGYSYHIELDPDRLLHESNPTNNRFPDRETQPFYFSYSPALNTTIIPVNYRPFLSTTSYLPEFNDLAYLTWMPEKVLPIPAANYQTHPIYSFFPSSSDYNLDNMTGTGWIELLLELTAVHNLEDPTGTRNYYGLVNSFDAHGCTTGCITGVSNLGATGGMLTGVGWSGYGAGTVIASRTMVHELGHNFGRPHVNCTGFEPKPDVNYPYSGGSIGHWGLDVVDEVLYDPKGFFDYMSYCQNVWTSDYTYWNIYNYRKSPSNQLATSLPATRTFYISGYQAPNGQIHLEPIYEQVSALTAPQTGNYRVELLGNQGEILATSSFKMVEVADVNGYLNFGFFVPAIDGLQGIRILKGDRVLAEKTNPDQMADFTQDRQVISIQLSEETLQLRWTDIKASNAAITYRLRYSQDRGQSWQVLALKLREPAFTMSIEPDLKVDGAIFEVQACDGIHTRTLIVSTFGE